MRCPKCGFHSFDYLDNCKKCGVDLTEQKLRFRFQGFVAPLAAEPEPLLEESGTTVPAVAEAEREAIDFGFDVLDDGTAPPVAESAGADTPADGEVDEFAPFDAFAGTDPVASDFAAEPATDFDFATDGELNLDQPFADEQEALPAELPKLSDRDNDFF